MSYFRSNVNAIAGYMPGEQPPPGTHIIKLNSNENPYPPSPKAIAALQAIAGEGLRRYPNPFGHEFRQAVSQVLDIPLDWVIVGNGSDDVLNVVIRACAEPGRKVVYPMPTYVLYCTLAAIQSAETVEIPYGENYELPLEKLIEAQGAVTLIASPNSPSGHGVAIADLQQLAAHLSGILVIDEAYVDFAETNALALVKEFNNVILIRTLSKGYSLAGLRLGFGIANPSLLSGLFKVKDSYNIDAIACAVGAAAILDQPYKNACADRIKTSRTRLTIDLKQLNFRVWDSQTNFLLVQPPQRNAEFLYQRLKSQNILVRYFNQPKLEDKLRITIGTNDQNLTLVEALTELAR
ncbi:MAG: histidinol-phosphate transaminase [Leptolyngbyaceae cyanobacterium CSU_1_3]|nr:histidinol-phosphate transaminase [Leptolyngbyaceae cyanobacterium CSU_1_3]